MAPRLMAAIIVFLLLFSFCFILFFASTPGCLQTEGIYTLPIENPLTHEPGKASDEVRVMTWNIAYGFGEGSDGNGYVPKSQEEMEINLKGIADYIRSQSVDLVVLQEVDRNSKRSGGLDEPRLLQEWTGLPYATFFPSWDVRYLPFPYWPLSQHMGRVQSGGLILSRYPLITHRGIRLPKPKTNPFWYNAFYIRRFVQIVTVAFPNGYRRSVWNLHLDAASTANREEQVDWIRNALESKIDPPPLFIAGDFNALPPEAKKRSGFPDNAQDEYEGDQSIAKMRKIQGFSEAVQAKEIEASESAWFTFPANQPNRMLDHVFTPSDVIVDSIKRGESGILSDHLPIIFSLSLERLNKSK